MDADTVCLGIWHWFNQGGGHELSRQVRPARWEVCEQRLDEGVPEGDGWEPFGSVLSNAGHTWIQWRRPV